MREAIAVYYYKTNRSATYKSIARIFGVSVATVGRILRQYRQTGSACPATRKRVLKPKVDPDWLRNYLMANPNSRLKDCRTAYEQATNIRVSMSTMCKMVKLIGYSHKKKEIRAAEQDSERVKQLRAEFEQGQQSLDGSRLVFIDESGMRLEETSRYAYAPRGKKAYGKEPHSTRKWIAMIGAIALDGIRSFVNIEAATTSEVFRAFVTQHLVPSLHKGDCVIMDNLSAHKDRASIAAIESVGAKVLFLPPYSPDLNPIEKMWSKIKTIVRQLLTTTHELFNDAVAHAGRLVTLSDILGWIVHCGYSVKSK